MPDQNISHPGSQHARDSPRCDRYLGGNSRQSRYRAPRGRERSGVRADPECPRVGVEDDILCASPAADAAGLLTGAVRGTIVAMTTDSLRNVKDRFSEFVDRVDREHERIVVTRNGRPAAVLISPDDLESLEETLAILSDTEAVKALAEAEAAVAAGDVVRGVDAVRSLRPVST